MKFLVALLLLSAMAQGQQNTPLDSGAAERFAKLALACVHKEYPNKIAHVLNSDADVKPPRELTPAFYGCYDWHSSVHGHWLLARLARTFPDASFAPEAWVALQQSLTPEHINAEVVYLKHDGNAAFERPYGLAWLMQLGAELGEIAKPHDEPVGKGTMIGKPGGPDQEIVERLAKNLEPLERAARSRLMTWLPKLQNPIRIGEHNQTAFSMGLLIDAARSKRDWEFLTLLTNKAREFYLNDKMCPLAYEPSGEDFLSPCLGEADVMRRVLPPAEFAPWLTTFLPQIPRDGSSTWLKPAVVIDPTDPKLAHLDGLNLSRAWMLEGIASDLPPSDKRIEALRVTAKQHADVGLAHVTGEHYEGGHWLGTFAVYLTTRRGTTHNLYP